MDKGGYTSIPSSTFLTTNGLGKRTKCLYVHWERSDLLTDKMVLKIKRPLTGKQSVCLPAATSGAQLILRAYPYLYRIHFRLILWYSLCWKTLENTLKLTRKGQLMSKANIMLSISSKFVSWSLTNPWLAGLWKQQTCFYFCWILLLLFV